MKLFLLLAGSYDKPNTHTGDWVDTYETREGAQAVIDKIKDNNNVLHGSKIDWFRIVDLNQWIN